ncbi:MAG: hypothetical protein Q9181_007087, partial [Wetmoreana brouardii]
DFKAVDLNADVKTATFECRPVKASSSRLVEITPGTSRALTARFKLRPGTPLTGSFEKVRKFKTFPSIWPTPEDTGRYIVRRNLEYILGNCTVPLGADTGAICMITDHVALPLGWMRDNFWQIRFLLDVYANIERLTDSHKSQRYSKMIKQTVKGHIKWIYQFAQRPHKFWHRSYLTTGRPKDGPVFQLDQQCYPLLELCDFFEACPEEREFVASILRHRVITEILELIRSKRDLSTGLFPTDETPGDDAVEYPFHFSSHVLLWYTITRLDQLVAEFEDVSHMIYNDLGIFADDIRAVTLNHFLFREPEMKPTYAYLVNGTGLRTFYHDANDIPTLFAPTWGFTRTAIEREAWRNTMNFAFSKANEGGFYGKGPFGGLGSVHTRGPWTLGYFQSWTFASMIGDRKEEEASWKKICGAMLWDGLFSEAVDGQTGECTSKAWFSWPGAMIGSSILHSLRNQ